MAASPTTPSPSPVVAGHERSKVDPSGIDCCSPRKRARDSSSSSWSSGCSSSSTDGETESTVTESSSCSPNFVTRKAVTPKAVSFLEQVAVCRILPRHDYTEDEICSAWFQEDEYQRIMKDCCKQIKKMNSGETLKDKKYCSRGLETHTKLRSITKLQNRKVGFDAVLDAQYLQLKHNGVRDDAEIAEQYIYATSSCQIWANVIGLRDQRAAEALEDDDWIQT